MFFLKPFSIAITTLGEERADVIAFRSFVRFALVWLCLFPLPLDVWEGLRFVIVALTGRSHYENTPIQIIKYRKFHLQKLKTFR